MAPKSKVASSMDEPAVAWACPYDEDTDPQAFECNLCPKRFTSWEAAGKHLNKKHLVNIMGSFLDKQIRAGKAFGISAEEVECVAIDKNSDKHFHCRLCLQPGGKPVRFAKRYALTHYKNAHAERDFEAVKKWAVVRDGTAIQHRSLRPLELTDAIQRYAEGNPGAKQGQAVGARAGEATEGDADGSDGEIEAAGQASGVGADQATETPSVEHAVMLLTSLDMLAREALKKNDYQRFESLFEKAIALRAELRHEMGSGRGHSSGDAACIAEAQDDAKLTARRENLVRTRADLSQSASSTSYSDIASIASAVAGAVKQAVADLSPKHNHAVQPSLKIRDSYLKWTEPARWSEERVLHRNCPLEEDESFCLDAFQEYLVTEIRQDQTKTVPQTLKAARRILGMFEIVFPIGDDSMLECKVWTVGFASALHGAQILGKLFKLEVLRPDFGWSRAMLTALKHFVDFARSNAIEARLDEDRKNIDDLLLKFRALTKTHTESKLDSGRKRTEMDADRIDKQPERDETRQVCKQAMFDMEYLWQHTHGLDNLTIGQKAAAITISFGLMYMNGKPGRCGEWKKIKMSGATAAWVDGGSDWVAADDHKTAKRRGASIKVLAPGTLAALKRYMSLPGMATQEYLFQAPRAGGGETVARYIQKFDQIYFGRICHFGSNLFRKKRANKRKEDAEKNARELGAWEDGHALGTEEANYIAMPHRKKADIARKSMMLEIEPVEWPTAEERIGMKTVYFAHPRRGDGGISADALAGRAVAAGETPTREGTRAQRGVRRLGRAPKAIAAALKRRRCASEADGLQPTKRPRGGGRAAPSRAAASEFCLAEQELEALLDHAEDNDRKEPAVLSHARVAGTRAKAETNITAAEDEATPDAADKNEAAPDAGRDDGPGDERRVPARGDEATPAGRGDAGSDDEPRVLARAACSGAARIEDQIKQLAAALPTRNLTVKQAEWILTQNFEFMRSLQHVAPVDMFEKWLQEATNTSLIQNGAITVHGLRSLVRRAAKM
jgi:hypothetical protein